MAYKMKPKGMGNNSYGMMPSNSKPKNKMAKIKGAGEKRIVGGSGFFGYLGGGGGLKAAGRIFKAFANTPKQYFAKATGHKAVTGKAGKIYGYEKDGLMTNSFKGLFNKSKKQGPSVDPNLLKKYPTGSKLHKFHKDQSKKFAEQFNKFTKKK